MKKKHLIMAMAVLGLSTAFTVCPKKDGFVIKGDIAGMPNGTVYLEAVGDGGKVQDSVQLVNGHFTFTGNVTEPKLHSIKVKGVKYGAVFLLDNEAITFKAKKDSISKGVLTGAKQDSIYRIFYKKDYKDVQKMISKLYRVADSLTQDGKVKLTADQNAMMDKRWADIDNATNKVVEKYITIYKDKVASALIVNDMIMPENLEKLEGFYAILTPEIQQSFYGKKLSKAIAIAKKTAVGVIAPDFTQNDVNGKAVKLSDYKGKYVLLDFWASWCGPCRQENPNVVLTYNMYHDKGFEVLGVSLDNKKEAWTKAIGKDGLNWTHVSDLKGWKNEVASLYGVAAVPTNLLIGPDGKIIAKNLRGEQLQSKIKEIFSKS